MAFKDLTIDFTKLMSVSLQQRVQLGRSPAASEIFGNLSPTEIAKLFPKYYLNDKKLPALSGMMGGTTPSGYTGGEGGTGGDSASPAGTGGGTGTGNNNATAPPPAPPKSVFDQIIDDAKPKPAIGKGNTQLPAGKRGQLGYAQTSKLTPKQKALLDAIATDSGGGYGTVNYVARGRGTNDVADLSKGHPFIRPDGSAIKGSTASGRYQILATNYVKFAKKVGAVDPITGVPDFSPEAQDLVAFEMAKDVYRVGTKGRNLESDINDPNMNAYDLIKPLSIDYGWHILKTNSGMNKAVSVFNNNIPTYEIDKIQSEIADVQTLDGATAPVEGGENTQGTEIMPIDPADPQQNNGQPTSQVAPVPFDSSKLEPGLLEQYNAASDEKKKLFEEAVTKIGVEKANQKYRDNPQVAPQTTVSAITNEASAGAAPISEDYSTLSGYYKDLQKNYPEKIDVDSPFWDTVDPSLKETRQHLVASGVKDGRGGYVNRDTLISTDAVLRLARKHGYTYRSVTGGGGDDEHSKNHGGKGRDTNYAIDYQFYDKNGKPVHIGKMPTELKEQFVKASLAGGANRLGITVNNHTASFHNQADDDDGMGNAAWGYDGSGSYSRSTLERHAEGRRLLKVYDENVTKAGDIKPELLSELGLEDLEYERKLLRQKQIESESATVQPLEELPATVPVEPERPAPGQNDTGIIPLDPGKNVDDSLTDVAGTQVEVLPSATPAEDPKNMMLGGVAPNLVKEGVEIKNTETGEQVNVNDREKISTDEYGNLHVESAHKVKAEELASKYDATPGKEQPVAQQQEESESSQKQAPQQPDNRGSMVSAPTPPNRPEVPLEMSQRASMIHSPSFGRAMNNTRFNDSGHFSRGNTNGA